MSASPGRHGRGAKADLEVADAAKTRTARPRGGRLDPPLWVVCDEVANVAPLPKLPDLAGGFGMQLVLAVQSLPWEGWRCGPGTRTRSQARRTEQTRRAAPEPARPVATPDPIHPPPKAGKA